jgi:peptide/nickel transport system substrate-binding protein
MSEKREHYYIPKLKEQLVEGKLDRREFLRYATLLGLSAPAAYAFAGKVTGEDFAPAARAQGLPQGGNLDPHSFSWVYDSNVVRQVAEYLTKTGHDNITRPYLVESWEASDDLKTWTLNMRKGVKWHNGRDLVADDAIANLMHMLNPESGSSVIGLMKGYMMNDEGTELWDANAIEKIDDHTFQMNLRYRCLRSRRARGRREIDTQGARRLLGRRAAPRRPELH